MTRTKRVTALLATLVVVGSGLAGCSSDKPAVCGDLDTLRTDVSKLQDVNVRENGISELNSQLATVKGDVAQLAKDAKDQYATEVDTVKKQAEAVGSSLDAAKASPSVQTLTAVRDALKALGTGLRDLESAVSGTC